MKHFILFIISLFVVEVMQGQNAELFERTQKPLSPSESNFNALSEDMDLKQKQQLYSNPAFYEFHQRNKQFYPSSEYKSVLSTSYSSGKQKGDFLTAEGNNFLDYRIMGSGQYSLKSAGTLFGSVQYAKGEHQNIGWSAARFPQLYQPYITTDSLGGDYIYEDYQASGGYSFQLGSYYVGAYGKFRGEQAHRKTDPRALHNTTWLGFGAGIAKTYNNHLFMFQAGYERNKQYTSLRYWRPGQQDRFFVAYGFGLYDVHQSTISFGYSRMYYINEANTSLTYTSPQDKQLTFYGNLNYTYAHMKTEESNIRDLYYSNTHRVDPTFRIDYKTNSSFSFSLFLDGNMNYRQGYENIFEQYLADPNNHVYDFRLIDTQQNYKRTQANGLAQLKATYQVNSAYQVSLLTGASLFYRDETYNNDYKIKNQALHPHIGIGLHLKKNKSELAIKGVYTYKQLLDNNYDVDITNTSVQHLDFQHAFTQYAYYNSSFSSVNLDVTYIYHLKKNAIGVNLQLMYKDGERDKETVYTGQIGFDSSAPRISAYADKHNEQWGKTSVFFVF